jgi:hypothetical protein
MQAIPEEKIGDVQDFMKGREEKNSLREIAVIA